MKESEYILSSAWGSLVSDDIAVARDDEKASITDTMWAALIKQNTDIVVPHLEFLAGKIKFCFAIFKVKVES